MDGDLSHDPVILPELINALLKYDIAIGSRFEKNSSVENWTWFRKSLSHVGVFLARILTQTHDPLSGYFFLKRSVIESTKLDTRGYKILLEILVKGVYKQVKEIPFRFRIRRFSASKLSWHEHILFLQQLLSYAWYKVGKRCKV
jgi:dolichol-phosphate mannosyltransferase